MIRYDDKHVQVHCGKQRVRGYKTLDRAMRRAELLAMSGAVVVVFPGFKSPILYASVRHGVTEVVFRSTVKEEV